MSRVSKIAIAVATCCLSVFMLAGCSSGFSASDLVQGNLDVIYLDTASSSYLKSINSDAETEHETYLTGLETELEYFGTHYDIDFDLAGDDAKDAGIDLLDKAYSHSKYEVGSAAQNGDTYVVPVTVYPMQFILEYDEGQLDADLETWRAQYASGAFANDAAAEAAWANMVISGVSKYLDPMSYGDPQTVQVQVEKDPADGLYVMNSSDFNRIDSLIFTYV